MGFMTGFKKSDCERFGSLSVELLEYLAITAALCGKLYVQLGFCSWGRLVPRVIRLHSSITAYGKAVPAVTKENQDPVFQHYFSFFLPV